MPKIKGVKIDAECCIGCGSCVDLAPEAFVLDPEEGKVELVEGWEGVGDDNLRRACEACPTRAISLDEGGE